MPEAGTKPYTGKTGYNSAIKTKRLNFTLYCQSAIFKAHIYSVDINSMHIFRHNLLRRLTLLVLLSWGMLTHVATVYACEAEKGKKQLSCCCDDGIMKKDCKHKKSHSGSNNCDTKNGDSNHNGFDPEVTFPGNIYDISSSTACCEVSYGITGTSLTSQASVSLKVVLLDAPRPPPAFTYLPDTVTLDDVAIPEYSLHHVHHAKSAIFLHTRRLRI